MKRSVRSGIAIAGLAGGFWLLGQAVADASTGDASTAGGATVASSGNGTSGSGAATTANATGSQTSTGSGGNTQDVSATNNTSNNATAGTVNAGGGTSSVGVIAGNGNTEVAKSGSGDVTAKQNVTTVVWVSSSATGAKVSGSGNAAAGNNATNKANATGTQNNKGGKHSGGNSQDVSATNNTSNNATAGTINAGGGTSTVDVFAGNENTLIATSGKKHHPRCEPSMEPVITASSLSPSGGCQQEWNKWKHHEKDGDVNASQNISTKVAVVSSATGAVVDNSGNAAAGNNASSIANATGTQNNEGKKGHKNREDCKEWDGGPSSLTSSEHPCWPGKDNNNGNSQNVDATNDTDNNAQGGDINAGGGTSTVDVVAGNGNTLYCTSKTGNVTCSQNITTIINIISKATGATVTCSGNASAGNSGHIVCQETIAPSQKPVMKPAMKPVMKPAVKTLIPVSHSTPVLSSTQSSGQLAFTGAETSLPLTLGLLALGAGGALTLAGRRRETATV